LSFLLVGGSLVTRAAEDDSNASFWLQERARQNGSQQQAVPHVVQRPTHLLRRAAPVKGFSREVPPGAPDATPPNAVPSDQNPDGTPPTDVGSTAPADNGAPANGVVPTPAKPTNGTFTVAVLGDSLGDELAQGLSEAFADKPELVVLHKANDNSGLVRDDYYDWVKAARDLLAGPGKIDAAVMMIGSNDRQQIRDGSGTADLHSPRWKQIYAARVEAIADLFHAKKIPLIWVGLPIMKSDRLSADMLDFNQIYRDSAAKAGATYTDVWEAFSDDRGQFTAYGPDVTGQFVKIRTSDGIHFTKAGARTMAHFVEDDLRHDEEQARPPVDPAVAALGPAPVSTAPGPAQNGPAQRAAGLVRVPVPAPPAAFVIPVKPAAGPVVPLNAPATARDGQLATLTPAHVSSADQSLADRALVEGHPLDPQPGRADDFSWPRQ
jgi:hypothetical protein